MTKCECDAHTRGIVCLCATYKPNKYYKTKLLTLV